MTILTMTDPTTWAEARPACPPHPAGAGSEARLAANCAELSAAVFSRCGAYEATPSVPLLSTFDCGSQRGVAIVVAEGNDKDDAAILAAAGAVTAFVDVIDRPLPAEADVLPALRRAVLLGHERVLSLVEQPVAPSRFGTSVGPRRTLKGIGASVAAAMLLPHRAWLTWVGECQMWLLRNGDIKNLNLPNTFGHIAGYRAAVLKHSLAADVAGDLADTPVKWLGLGRDPPTFDVTRLDLRGGDSVVVGNVWVTAEMVSIAAAAGARSASGLCDALATAVAAAPRGRLAPAAGAVAMRAASSSETDLDPNRG
jgi:hypothetical protein